MGHLECYVPHNFYSFRLPRQSFFLCFPTGVSYTLERLFLLELAYRRLIEIQKHLRDPIFCSHAYEYSCVVLLLSPGSLCVCGKFLYVR